MGSVGSNQNYIRFGAVPKGEESLDFTKLNLEQQRDITSAIEYGDIGDNFSIRDYIQREQELFGTRTWKNVDADKIFEKGVSVFKADSNGMPIIENITQAQSLAVRIGDKDVFNISGKRIGTGQDKEPILKDTKSTQVKINDTKLVNHLIKTLKANFNTVTGKKDLSKSNDIFTFADFKTGETYYVYKGLEFRGLKKNFTK